MKKDLHLHLEQALIERIDEYKKTVEPKPTRNALIEWLLDIALKYVDGEPIRDLPSSTQ